MNGFCSTRIQMGKKMLNNIISKIKIKKDIKLANDERKRKDQKKDQNFAYTISVFFLQLKYVRSFFVFLLLCLRSSKISTCIKKHNT